MKNCDFLVMGGGSAGYAAARTAHEEGLSVVVVEGGAEVGGLCILRGCMPSKTLIESANRMRTLERADEFGLRAGEIGFDGEAIIARKRRLIREFAEYRIDQLADGRFEFLRGKAVFLDANRVRVAGLDGSEETVAFRACLIATGSHITAPPIPGLAEAGYFTSDEALDRSDLPGSLIVLGGGPIALELAHFYASLGTETTIIQRSPHVLSSIDRDVAEALERAYRARGIALYTGTQLSEISEGNGRKRVRFEQLGEHQSIEGDDLLMALGRSPNIDGLGLEAAGVSLDGKRIATRPTQQTSAAHVFAAGDVCGPHEIVHIAIQQGEIAARNAARLLRGEPATEEVDYRLLIFVAFTEPQVAVTGQCEHQLHEAGVPIRVARYPFDDHGKSLVMGEPEGFVKLIAHAETGELLGGACIGPHASDLIHEITVAMAFHSTAAQLARIPHYHPTLSEIWTYPAEALAGGSN